MRTSTITYKDADEPASRQINRHCRLPATVPSDRKIGTDYKGVTPHEQGHKSHKNQLLEIQGQPYRMLCIGIWDLFGIWDVVLGFDPSGHSWIGRARRTGYSHIV
jgi:hypothetical protein